MNKTHTITLIVLTIVLTILVSSEVLALWCYQETANVSIECGGIISGGGNYLLSGSWVNPQETYDGNWDSLGYSSSGISYAYINYTKPIGATNLSLWQVKGGIINAAPTNLSLSSCWTNNSILQLRVESNYALNKVTFSCFNGTDWISIQTFSEKRFFEDGLFWDINLPFPNSTKGYNLNVLEYTNQTFTLNFTYQNITNITANLTYNGTTYPATSTHDDTTWNFTTSIIIPQVSATYNETKQFYWTYTIFYETGENVTYISFDNQIVHRLRIQNTSTLAVQTLNFTVRNEKDNSLVLAKATSNWKIWAIGNDETTQSRSYSYVNPPNSTHLYYLYPTWWANATVEYSILLENSTYAPRTYSTEINVSNSSQSQTLYLLRLEDGSYVTFQVLTAANAPISGVTITAEKYISGSWTLIQQGITDEAGTYTFFLDPTVLHRFNFTKTGYEPYSIQLTPTQSSYTVTLESSMQEEQSYNRGITYQIQPTQSILLNNTNYTFAFNVISNFYSLQECGFILKNASGTVLGSATDDDPTNCYAYSEINTGNNSRIIMYYYWKINDTYMNATYSWYVKYTYQGQYSIKTFIDDLRNFADNRTGGFDDFGLMFLFFLVLLVVTAKISYESGVYSPIAILSFIFTAVFFADYVGLLPNFSLVPYFTTILVGLVFIAYIIHEYA